jgi:hypothetical protein
MLGLQLPDHYSKEKVVRRDFPAYCALNILDSGTVGGNLGIFGIQGCSK